MSFGDLVQFAAESEQAEDGIITATLPVGATAGNLLIGIALRNASNIINAPTGGWTLLSGIPSGQALGGNWYYKVATGGETSFTCDITPSTSGTIQAVIAEFEGPFASAILDGSGEDETNVNSSVTSQSTGSVTVTSAAPTLVLACFMADVQSAISGGTRAYTNSFVEALFPATTSTHGQSWLAKRVVTAAGSYSSTFSVDDTGTPMYGAVAAFRSLSGFIRKARGSSSLAIWTPGTPRVVTLGQALAVGNLALCFVLDFDLGLTYTVSGGGTWVSRLRYEAPTTFLGTIEVFSTIVSSAVSSVSVDADDNGAEIGSSITVVEFSGQAATPFSVTPGDFEGNADPTPDVSVSTTVNPSLLLHAIISGGGSTATKPPDFTLESSLAGATHVVSWKEVTATGTQTATPTLSGGDDNSISVLIAVDGASGGTPPAAPTLYFRRRR